MSDGSVELLILGLLAASGATALSCLVLGFAPLLRAPRVREIPGVPPSAPQPEVAAPAPVPLPAPEAAPVPPRIAQPARKPTDWLGGLRKTRGAFVERL